MRATRCVQGLGKLTQDLRATDITDGLDLYINILDFYHLLVEMVAVVAVVVAPLITRHFNVINNNIIRI